MTGLILTDLLSLKKQFILCGVIAAVYIVFGIMSDNPSMMIMFLILFATMSVISAFSYNELSKWESLASTFPVVRSDFVWAKYGLLLMFEFGAGFLGAVSMLIYNFVQHRIWYKDFSIILAAMGIGLFLMSVVIPIIFKLGPEKARMIMLAVFMIPFLIILGLEKMGKFGAVAQAVMAIDIQLLLILAVVIVIAVFAVSVIVSLAIYKKKEL